MHADERVRVRKRGGGIIPPEPIANPGPHRSFLVYTRFEETNELNSPSVSRLLKRKMTTTLERKE